jgi:hypothetical protein
MATKRSAETNYNTHLASEFLMMSLFNRAGMEAYLSMGNKKGVDIVAKTKKGAICVVEVKGVNKKNDWLITNTGKFPEGVNLFYALICYNGNIKDLTATPDFWLIPSHHLSKKTQHKISKNGKTVYLSHSYITENYEGCRNTLEWLEGYLEGN